MEFYATLSPNCAKAELLKEMFDNGMTGIRLNLSHVSLAESAPLLAELHRAEEMAGKKADIIIDTQGPEIRIGAAGQTLVFEEGFEVLFGEGGIPVPEIVVPFLKPGQEILLDDGKIQLFIEESNSSEDCDDLRTAARVVRGGSFSGRKSMALPGASVYPPTLTEADLSNIAVAKKFGVTGLLQSFVRGKSDLDAVRRALDSAGGEDIKIYAKVENADGTAHLGELIEGSDVVVIARGDLGNSMPLWELPAAQKHISEACRAAGRPFIVVTQLLASMEERAVPTRAEVNDIFNSVLDGASGLMVTGETAAGKYPAEVMKYLKNTADAALSYSSK